MLVFDRRQNLCRLFRRQQHGGCRSEDNNMEDTDEICEDTEEEVVTKPTASEVLWKYCRIDAFFCAETGLLHRFDSLHTRDQIATKKQSIISHYFTRTLNFR